MGLFEKATNEQGFLKASLMGFPGSGKTFTASLLAIGLHKSLKETRPVYALDTEKGFDYIAKKFEQESVPLKLARTRAFSDLLLAIDEAEKEASILIVDSVTHFWQEIQEAYKREHKRQQLRLQDWGPIKANWAQFPVKFLNSKLHIILCGRAGDDYEYQENEDTGRMEVYKAGTKMMAEKNLGYEPGLVVEMEKVNLGQFKRGKRTMVNRAHVLKDRFDVLDGQSFDDPTYETFQPHIANLNLGQHVGISSTTSKEMFEKDSDRNFYEKRKKVEVLKEEIQGELVLAYPGRSAEEVKAKTEAIKDAFGTTSWLALDDMSPETLRKGLDSIKLKLAAQKEQAIALAKANGEKPKKSKEAA